MMFQKKINSIIFFFLIPLIVLGQRMDVDKHNNIKIKNGSASYQFTLDFKLVYSETDPNMQLRNLSELNYFAPTWEASAIPANKIFKDRKKDASRGGDGIDESLNTKITKGRTGDIFYSGRVLDFEHKSVSKSKDTTYVEAIIPDYGKLMVKLYQNVAGLPTISYVFIPQKEGFYSVLYNGTPSFKYAEVKEVWQPMVWQQKRFPVYSYLTLAFQCPIPATLVGDKSSTIGVLAATEEIPFQPLPTRDNNRFGVALRNQEGDVQPMMVAPVLGHMDSKMAPNEKFGFTFHLVVTPNSLSKSYEDIARNNFKFTDYRKNDFTTVNQTLDNMIDYGLSEYSCFIDSLKGCSYSTDVPGSTKNVSSLNPLSISLVTDNEKVFSKRAYPIMEYMLSRDNTLFCLDTTQKVQSPSRKLGLPCASISELGTLYSLSGKTSSFLLRWAENKYYKYAPSTEREHGRGLWFHALEMYRSTGDKAYLDWAIRGAKYYIKTQITEPPTKLRAEFFWTSYAPKYISLLELYEITKDKEFLEAAHFGARQYSMFVWMTPQIPNETITVNKGNKAPWYWYLKSRGIPQQSVPEETVEAWRLSETGLVAESSTTGIGHRAVFMAHHAPYFLRLYHYTGDTFLRDIARSALVGRYSNFPGYHINTERTTVYEKKDFPLRWPNEISANSFHYNHPFPHMTILLDYLVTDALNKSAGKIEFPSLHIEGYGYLQNKFYGHEAGSFYGEKDIWLWMPQRLLTTSNVELNYLSGRSKEDLYVAFMNQSSDKVESLISFNLDILPQMKGKTFQAEVWSDNKKAGTIEVIDGKFAIACPDKGISSVIVRGVNVESKFQNKFVTKDAAWKNDYYESEFGRSSALLINMGKDLKKAYVFLRDDDSVFEKVNMIYRLDDGKFQMIEDISYPYEFTIDIPSETHNIYIQLSGIDKNKQILKSEMFKLSKK